MSVSVKLEAVTRWSVCYSAVKRKNALPGIVESSNNLGVITLDTGQNLGILNLCRSASNDERDAHAVRISQYQQQFGLKVDICGAYPGWQPNPDSQLLKQGLALYQTLFNKTAVIQVIHAGLECGLLSDVYPACDIISFGPTITGAHSHNGTNPHAVAWGLLPAING